MTEPRHIGLLCCAEMVRAFLREHDPKTQTRRMNGLEYINERPDDYTFNHMDEWRGKTGAVFHHVKVGGIWIVCPYGVGDIVYVKETHALRVDIDWRKEPQRAKHYCHYKADDSRFDPKDEMNWHNWGGKWRSSRFMPYAVARIHRVITKVRPPERVQSISEADAKAEGAHFGVVYLTDENGRPTKKEGKSYRLGFRELWDSLYAAENRGWNYNPWVWPIELGEQA